MAATHPVALVDEPGQNAEVIVETLLSAEPTAFLFAAGKCTNKLYEMPLGWKARFCRALHLRAVSSGGGFRGDNSKGDLTVVEDILLNTRGTELTALKLALDSMDDSVQHDLVHLYLALGQMPDGERRTARLLAHFRRQAVDALQSWHSQRRQEYWDRMQALGLPPDAVAAARSDPGAQPRLAPSWPVMLFSDFDDTMMAKLLDYSFPGGVAYPGVSAFLRAMQGEFGGRVGIRPGQVSADSAGACLPGSCVAAAPAAADDTPGPSTDEPPVLSETDVHVRRRKRDQLRDWMKGWLPASGAGNAPSAPGSDGAGGAAPAAASPPAASSPTPAGLASGGDGSRKAPGEGEHARGVSSDRRMDDRQTDDGQADDAADEAVQAARKAADEAAAERADCPALRLESGDLRAAAAPSPAGSSAQLSGAPAAAASAGVDGAAAAGSDAASSHCTRRQCSDACMESVTGHLGISGTVYLSARPDLMKEKTLASTSAILGHPPQAILCGTFRTLASNAGMAARKAENYNLYHALFPEFRVVWLGDSGQGDIDAGLQMLRMHVEDEAAAAAEAATAAAEAAATAAMAVDGVAEAAGDSGSASVRWWPPPPPLVLIHDVCASNQTPYSDEGRRAALLSAGVNIFDSYADAACIAFEHGLLSEAALRGILEAVTRELPTVIFRSAEQRAARLVDYHRAMRRCRAAMQAHDDRRCLVQALPAPLRALLPSAPWPKIAGAEGSMISPAAPSPVWAGSAAEAGAGAMVAAL